MIFVYSIFNYFKLIMHKYDVSIYLLFMVLLTADNCRGNCFIRLINKHILTDVQNKKQPDVKNVCINRQETIKNRHKDYVFGKFSVAHEV